MTASEDWKICLVPTGTLFAEKLCGICGGSWWVSEIPGGAPAGMDVYELFIDRGPCKKCPEPKGGRDGTLGGTDLSRNDSLAVEPDALRGHAVASRRGAGPMAMIHSLVHRFVHRLQEAAGRRVCVFCGLLTGNRYRPISFHLGRRYRHGRRVGMGKHPHGPSA